MEAKKLTLSVRIASASLPPLLLDNGLFANPLLVDFRLEDFPL